MLIFCGQMSGPYVYPVMPHFRLKFFYNTCLFAAGEFMISLNFLNEKFNFIYIGHKLRNKQSKIYY